MKRRGSRWSDIKHTSLEEHGFSILAIKEWRKREHDAGRPSELIDFYSRHRLCYDCSSRGVKMIGWDNELQLWNTCESCGGSGTV